MKKIYQAPSTEIVFVTMQQMIAASQVEGGFNPTEVPETTETNGNLSRRKDVWYDEEEEEQW